MNSIHIQRLIAQFDERLRKFETSDGTGSSPSSFSSPSVDLTDVINRLAALEAKPEVDLTGVNTEIKSLESSLATLETTVNELKTN